MGRIDPCPLCGGEGCLAEHIYYPKLLFRLRFFGVVCLDCYCGTSQDYETKDQAIEAWNSGAIERNDDNG